MEPENNNNFPLEMVDVEPKLAEELMKQFTGEYTGFVRVGPKGYFLPHKYRLEASNIFNMPLRADDVFVASYPRSGTTWTQELVWMVAKDLDYATSEAVPLTERYPFLEFSVYVHRVMKEKFRSENSDDEHKLKLLEWVTQPATDQLEAATAQRFIKTHLPMSLLPPELLDRAKMVYVARDPRDVVVSFYHLNRLIRTQGYIGDFKTYWNYFMRDLQTINFPLLPGESVLSYADEGSIRGYRIFLKANHWTPYFEHIKEAWEKRHHPNMLFLFYEELSKDLPAAVRRVAAFFNKEFTEEQVAKLCDHLSINNFKKNKAVNYDVMKELGILIPGEQSFIRNGKAGGWRDYFDADMAREAENWMAENLKDTDFRFPHSVAQ